MDAVSYTEVRKNFTRTMNGVCKNHAPLIITRKSSTPVVMISLPDYNAIEETLYLFKSPSNAQRLMKALKSIKKNDYSKHSLIEEIED